MKATILDISGSGMRLRAPLPAACGGSVEIEAGGSISLGEVCRCAPLEGGYEIGIQISHTLSASRDDLENLHRSLTAESRSAHPVRR